MNFSAEQAYLSKIYQPVSHQVWKPHNSSDSVYSEGYYFLDGHPCVGSHGKGIVVEDQADKLTLVKNKVPQIESKQFTAQNEATEVDNNQLFTNHNQIETLHKVIMPHQPVLKIKQNTVSRSEKVDSTCSGSDLSNMEEGKGNYAGYGSFSSFEHHQHLYFPKNENYSGFVSWFGTRSPQNEAFLVQKESKSSGHKWAIMAFSFLFTGSILVLFYLSSWSTQ